MRTHKFEGEDYVKSGEYRAPKRGEIFLESTGRASNCVINDWAENEPMEILTPKKEAKMDQPKYQATDKKISRMSIWEAIEDKTCQEALNDYNEFDREFNNQGMGYSFPYSEGTRLQLWLEKQPQRFTDFALKHGFLEESKPKFEPVSLLIETEEEFNALWHRLNLSDYEFEEVYNFESEGRPPRASNCESLWRKIKQIQKERR